MNNSDEYTGEETMIVGSEEKTLLTSLDTNTELTSTNDDGKDDDIGYGDGDDVMKVVMSR